MMVAMAYVILTEGIQDQRFLDTRVLHKNLVQAENLRRPTI